jgi:hypothetical protein
MKGKLVTPAGHSSKRAASWGQDVGKKAKEFSSFLFAFSFAAPFFKEGWQSGFIS